MLTVTIDPSGAAFEEDAASEVQRILDVVREDLATGRLHPDCEPKMLRDVNGNTCGAATWDADA